MGSEITDQDEVKEPFQNPFIESLFEPILLTAMIMCLSISLNRLIIAIKSRLNKSYF